MKQLLLLAALVFASNAIAHKENTLVVRPGSSICQTKTLPSGTVRTTCW